MTRDRLAALAVASGPIILLVGILWHPFIPNLTDNADVVAHLQEDTTAWFGAHFLIALGSAFLLLGFLAARAIAPLVVGSTMFTMLPAMEIGMLAVHEVGGDLLATQNALDTWFVPILLVSAFLLAVGTIMFAVGVKRADILPAGLSRTVTVAFVVSAVSRVPFTAALMAGIVALVVAMLPLAATMWKAGTASTRATATT